MGLAYEESANTPIPAELYELFPVLKQMLGIGAAVTCRAGSSSNWPLRACAWPRSPSCSSSTSQPKAFSPASSKTSASVIRMLADRGDMAILLVEQYYDFAEALADRYIVMERGEVIASGPGSEMQAKGVRQLVAI